MDLLEAARVLKELGMASDDMGRLLAAWDRGDNSPGGSLRVLEGDVIGNEETTVWTTRITRSGSISLGDGVNEPSNGSPVSIRVDRLDADRSIVDGDAESRPEGC